MAIKDVLLSTRGPLLPPSVEAIREEATAAHLRSSDLLRGTLKSVIREHNKLRGVKSENDGEDDGQNN